MMPVSAVDNPTLKAVRDILVTKNPGKQIRAWQIRDAIQDKFSIRLDESTIRGRFVDMGEPLSGAGVGTGKPKAKVEEGPKTQRGTFSEGSMYGKYKVPEELLKYVPKESEFIGYIERDVDKRLSMHYNLNKYPITQGKQGTGKTFSHMFFAFRAQLPFFLYSGYEDFKLPKLFGDKTIKNGSIVFQESLFVKAIQHPSVVLFDEINAISNANTFDFHALLQNRELFIKDANDGKGMVYKLHPECKIGFAQNPKSAKYIGGSIKASNFLGRCTYLTYPEFTKKQIKEAVRKRYPTMETADIEKFSQFYFAIIETIERSSLPVDVSIRQLNNVIDLWMAGMPLKDAIEDGLSSILESVSQPKAKESMLKIAQAVWKELM